MKLSVIMGAYNAEKTIAKAIESILNQTFLDFIFIICDDGSTDKTKDIIETYALKHPDKIKAIKNEKNSGLSYTLNHCLSYANTEYVARMDADDYSLPDRLTNEVDFLDRHKEYAFVGCAVERFDEDGVWKKCKVINEPTKKNFCKSSCFTHPTIVIRTSILKAVGGYTEAWYTDRCEDYDLWMKLYVNGYKGYNLSEILFQYYEGKDSFPKRKYRYRIGEAVMRARGYAALKMYPQALPYVIKPLIAGVLPSFLVKRIHSN